MACCLRYIASEDKASDEFINTDDVVGKQIAFERKDPSDAR